MAWLYFFSQLFSASSAAHLHLTQPESINWSLFNNPKIGSVATLTPTYSNKTLYCAPAIAISLKIGLPKR